DRGAGAGFDLTPELLERTGRSPTEDQREGGGIDVLGVGDERGGVAEVDDVDGGEVVPEQRAIDPGLDAPLEGIVGEGRLDHGGAGADGDLTAAALDGAVVDAGE